MREVVAAEKDGRCMVLPEGYEYATEFYHVVNVPKWCNEDGGGCEGCKYEVINDCKFKPYVAKVSPNSVFSALYVLEKLRLTREAAEAALKEGQE
jgi:hypothetical protein